MFEDRKRRFDPDSSRTRERIPSRSDSNRRLNDTWTRSKREPISFRENSGRDVNPHMVDRSADKVKIDRTKTCPMMIRLYCNIGRHHKISEYSVKKFPENEIKIYTWRDATLRELMGLVTEAFPQARSVGTCFDFSIVYPNFRSKEFEMKPLGSTCSGQDRNWDSVSLRNTNFHVGDCLDVAIYLPKQRAAQL